LTVTTAARLITVWAAALAFLAAATAAQAASPVYIAEGGTLAQRAEVRAALAASSFEWRILPRTVTVHIRPGDTKAADGHVWVDSRLLDSGRFSWGFVQHEFAHQVDFMLLDDAARAQFLTALGGRTWCERKPGFHHEDYGCERFASTLAWTFWPSSANALRPRSRSDEAAAMAPASFRRLLARFVPAARPLRR
jgi:hypothetical protein